VRGCEARVPPWEAPGRHATASALWAGNYIFGAGSGTSSRKVRRTSYAMRIGCTCVAFGCPNGRPDPYDVSPRVLMQVLMVTGVVHGVVCWDHGSGWDQAKS